MKYLFALCACVFVTHYSQAEELQKLEIKWICVSPEKYVQMQNPIEEDFLVSLDCDDDDCCKDGKCNPK